MKAIQTMKGMIGLEIHSYIITEQKLFCECKASREKGIEANIHICPICTGMPGAKPMLPNEEAVKKAVMISSMLGCKTSNNMPWQRKHYSWPDLPKGYQNTLSGSGAIPLGINGKFKGVNIWSMHLEEDPASWDPETGEVDYNRSGLPLVEIITAPDFSTSEEVMQWLTDLTHALAYLKAVDSNAGIKVDVNVNIPGKSERVELKNLSSIENIGKAIEYELVRQTKEGGKVRETRRYDDKKNMTVVMRTKEAADDYRFIRDPDLTNLNLTNEYINQIKERLPESPDVKLEKLVKKFKIDKINAKVLAENIDIVEFFEGVAAKIDISIALSWVTVELLRLLNYHKKRLDEVDIKPEHFVELLKLIKEGKITPLKGKEILNSFYPKSFMPSAAEVGKITDKDELTKVAQKVIAANNNVAEDYKNGNTVAINFLLGEIMKETKKRADFAIAREVLEKLLK